MKTCSGCKTEKSLDNFWFNKKTNLHRSSCKECCNERNKKCIVPKERKAFYDKIYREKHKEKLKISKKEEYERNKESYIARSIKQQQTPLGRLKHNIRTRIGNAIKRGSKFSSSKDLLGCDIEFYIEYMEYLFDETMNWENYGEVWHIDHVNPLCNYDLIYPEQQRLAFNYTNTRPLSANENLSRSKKSNSLEILEHNNKIKNFKCNTFKLRETP